jgi:hypothetical protein
VQLIAFVPDVGFVTIRADLDVVGIAYCLASIIGRNGESPKDGEFFNLSLTDDRNHEEKDRIQNFFSCHF